MRLRGGAVEGALGSGALTGLLATVLVNDADPILSVIVGAALGVAIGLAVVMLALFIPLERWFPFPLLGGVVGAILFGTATLFGIEIDDIVDGSWLSLVIGFIIGAIVGGVVMREKRRLFRQKIEK